MKLNINGCDFFKMIHRNIFFRIIFFWCFLCLVPSNMFYAYGQEISLTASVDRNKVSLGQRIRFVLKIGGDIEDAKLSVPSLLDFDIVSKQRSSSTRIVNFDSERYMMYTYILEPLKAGKFIIGAAKLKVDDKIYESEPLTIEVDKAVSSVPKAVAYGKAVSPAGSNAAKGIPVDIDNGDKAFLELTSDRDEVFVGQQVTLIFRFYYRRMNVSDFDYDLPGNNNFLEESLGGNKSYYRNINGYRYAVFEVNKALFPLSAGEHIIPKGIVDFISTRNFFESERLKLASRPLTIKVKPLPEENRPLAFNNAVGAFKITTDVAPKTVKIGEPITVNIKVRGQGNIKAINFPGLKDTPGFKSYEPEVKDKMSHVETALVGEKTLEKIYVPKWSGLHNIKTPDFTFFDPYREKYVTIKGKSVEVKVEDLSAEERTQGSMVVENKSVDSDSESKDTVNVIRQSRDINFIKMKAASFRKKTFGKIFYINVFLLPLFIYLLLYYHQFKKEKLKTDVKYARKIKAGRTLSKNLKKAAKAVKRKQVREFYLCADKALRECISNKTALSSAGMTLSGVVDILRDKNIEEKIIADTEDIFNKCDMVKFVTAEISSEEMKADYDTLREVISLLLKKL